MDILAIQQRVLDEGFMYTESVTDKKAPRNCVIAIQSQTTLGTIVNPESHIGPIQWNNLTREEGWHKVAEWLDDQEVS